MHDDSTFPHPPDLHPPAPSFWQNPLLPQGLGLAALALGAFVLLIAAARKSLAAATLLSPVLGVAAFLAAWASAIHLTGGEKFDDHPWI